jgi:hypothetical protein
MCITAPRPSFFNKLGSLCVFDEYQYMEPKSLAAQGLMMGPNPVCLDSRSSRFLTTMCQDPKFLGSTRSAKGSEPHLVEIT